MRTARDDRPYLGISAFDISHSTQGTSPCNHSRRCQLLAASNSVNWVQPLWIVAVGVAVIAAASFGLYYLLTLVAPKVAAIARTSTKEAWSQPLFWVTLSIGIVLLLLFPFIPYYTLGEDVKMIKDSGLALITVLSIILAVWTASVSVSEEIEGRTALTLLSKPVGRRQFILGKFLGVLAPTFSLFVVLGALFLCTISYKVKHEARETSSPEPTAAQCQAEMVQIVPGLALKFMEATMLASISVALSTRLSMLPNLVICVTIYALGHLCRILRTRFANRSWCRSSASSSPRYCRIWTILTFRPRSRPAGTSPLSTWPGPRSTLPCTAPWQWCWRY